MCSKGEEETKIWLDLSTTSWTVAW